MQPESLVPISCSQNLRTRIPCRRSFWDVTWSRFRFRDIFSRQNAEFLRGKCPQRGHPCQKHPSTKIARFWFSKKKSGSPGTCLTFMLHPLMPALVRAARSLTSVVLVPLPLTAFIILLCAGLVSVNSPFGSFFRRAFSTQPSHFLTSYISSSPKY